MTPQEKQIINSTVLIWTQICDLLKTDGMHPDDVEDSRHAVHEIQRIIHARAGRREPEREAPPAVIPDSFFKKNGDGENISRPDTYKVKIPVPFLWSFLAVACVLLFFLIKSLIS